MIFPLLFLVIFLAGGEGRGVFFKKNNMLTTSPNPISIPNPIDAPNPNPFPRPNPTYDFVLTWI